MDVRQYFNPVDFSTFSEKGNAWKYSLGQVIEKSTGKVSASNLHKVDVAILGVPLEDGNYTGKKANVPDKIRSELYKLAGFQTKVTIVDFGNLKKAKTSKAIYLALRDIVEYFNELDIVTVVLGGSQDLSFGVSQAFRNNRYFTLSCIDSVLDVKKGKEQFGPTNFLSRIFSALPNLFQFSLLAFQSHLVPHQLFSKTKGVNEHCRLGLLRDNISLAEPVLRNTNFLSFDIGAIKYSDAPGTSSVNPNGLRSEEACQLAKYAGLSNQLNVFGIFGNDWLKDVGGVTIKLSAQIVWYFLEGQTQRYSDEKEKLITYKVEVKDIDKPLVFMQCPETLRWWMEVKSMNGLKMLIACSEREYELASDNEIPELWLKYVQKIDEILK